MVRESIFDITTNNQAGLIISNGWSSATYFDRWNLISSVKAPEYSTHAIKILKRCVDTCGTCGWKKCGLIHCFQGIGISSEDTTIKIIYMGSPPPENLDELANLAKLSSWQGRNSLQPIFIENTHADCIVVKIRHFPFPTVAVHTTHRNF